MRMVTAAIIHVIVNFLRNLLCIQEAHLYV